MRKINVLADGSRMYLENAHGWNYYKTVDILNEVPHNRLRKGFGLKKGLVLLGKPVSRDYPEGFMLFVVQLEKEPTKKRVEYRVNFAGKEGTVVWGKEKPYESLHESRGPAAAKRQLVKEGWVLTHENARFGAWHWRRDEDMLYVYRHKKFPNYPSSAWAYDDEDEELEDVLEAGDREEPQRSYDTNIFDRFGVKGTVRERILVEQNYDDESSFVYECLEPFYSKKVGEK